VQFRGVEIAVQPHEGSFLPLIGDLFLGHAWA